MRQLHKIQAYLRNKQPPQAQVRAFECCCLPRPTLILLKKRQGTGRSPISPKKTPAWASAWCCLPTTIRALGAVTARSGILFMLVRLLSRPGRNVRFAIFRTRGFSRCPMSAKKNNFCLISFDRIDQQAKHGPQIIGLQEFSHPSHFSQTKPSETAKEAHTYIHPTTNILTLYAQYRVCLAVDMRASLRAIDNAGSLLFDRQMDVLASLLRGLAPNPRNADNKVNRFHITIEQLCNSLMLIYSDFQKFKKKKTQE
jgi:hypothetical protein